MKKVVIGTIIFVLVFILLAIGITALLINKQKNIYLDQEVNNNTEIIQKENEDKDKQQNEIVQEEGIDLYGTYNENDLIIKEVIEQYNGSKVGIPKIEGLKNKDIENKINNDIKEVIYSELTLIDEIDYANFQVYANFSNIISIRYYADSKSGEDYLNFGLNYELVNGEKLNIEDIFKKDADILEIVRNSFYESLNYYNFEYEWDGGEPVEYVDEYEFYKFVKAFMGQEDKYFTITPTEIEFYYEKKYAREEFLNISEDVVIYNKYLTDESIYERDDIGRKDIFTCVDASDYDIFENIEYGYLEDNLWYDITSDNWNEYAGDLSEEKYAKYQEYENKIYNYIQDVLNEYKEKARQNPDKFYIFISKPKYSIYNNGENSFEDGRYVLNYFYSDMLVVNPNIQIYEMPMSLYEEKYRDRIIEEYRYQYFMLNGGVSMYLDEEEGIETKYLDKEKLYNFVKGEELTELTDIFIETSSYMDIINSEVRKELNNLGYSVEQVEELITKVEYEVKGEAVVCKILELPDFEVTVYFRYLDRSLFKLFNN